MRGLRFTLYILTAAILAVGLGGSAYAFHDGGVATCTRCHSMHSAPATAVHLTVGSDQSSTCLSCHERAGYTGPNGYHISTPASELTLLTQYPKQMTPGGDFGWIRQNFLGVSTGHGTLDNLGRTRGHNIQAIDNGYTELDGTAPGGGASAMSSADLACTSCHDPHSRARRIDDGNDSIVYPPATGTYAPIAESGSYGAVPPAGEAVGVYRLLGGANYNNPTNPGPFPGNPAAVVPSSYNKKETNGTTDQVRVAYGHGTTNGYATWAEWCANCHPGMHTTSAPNPVHPVEDILDLQAAIYNKYVKTGDLTGTSADSFNSLVPFALNTTTTATLTTASGTLTGPTSSDRVLCLSCHRAHASAWQYALRWNNAAEFMTLEDGGVSVYPGVDIANSADPNAIFGDEGSINTGYTVEQMTAAYYDRPATVFAPNQRALCNKCHNKD
ncbi:MAG TPA: hypothetical protein VNI57_06835 [Candidatus Saccharimonadales bacterium]|nr:hypothetical protein [Candidatus Saccharimonadales bacterium]